MLKKIAVLQLAMLMSISLVACGDNKPDEKSAPSKVQMTIQIENGRYVDITGLSVTSDTRVNATEELENPEAVGVSSILTGDYEGTLRSGDYITIELETDDPKFYATSDESTENKEGVQKFVFNVMDTNGTNKNFRDIELKDGAYYIITNDEIKMFDNAEDGQNSELSLYGNYIKNSQGASEQSSESEEVNTDTNTES